MYYSEMLKAKRKVVLMKNWNGLTLCCTTIYILITIFSCVVRNGKMDQTHIGKGGGGVVHEDKTMHQTQH